MPPLSGGPFAENMTVADELASDVLVGLCIGLGSSIHRENIEEGRTELDTNMVLTEEFLLKASQLAYQFADAWITEKMRREALP